MKTNPNSKRILIYGDSITWGRVPASLERFDAETRFTGVVQNELGDEFEIIEEGLRSRSVKGEDISYPNRDGFKQFPGIYSSHLPLNLTIIFLGANDLIKTDKDPSQIADELLSYLDLINLEEQSMGIKTERKVLFITPPIFENEKIGRLIGKNVDVTHNCKLLEDEMEIRTRSSENLYLLKSSDFIKASKDDYVHLDKESNLILGKELAIKIKEII